VVHSTLMSQNQTVTSGTLLRVTRRARVRDSMALVMLTHAKYQFLNQR
jgi:hypothetical protein